MFVSSLFPIRHGSLVVYMLPSLSMSVTYMFTQDNLHCQWGRGVKSFLDVGDLAR